MKKDLWLGLNERTRKALSPRDYKSGSVAQRIAASGVDAAELTTGRGKAELKKVWIPGVEIFPGKFIHNAIVAALVSWRVKRRECWARSSYGLGNGRPRECSRTAQKDFTFIHLAFQRR